MSIITISLPPGLYMNGTLYDAKNRWAGGNRVRWHNDAMRPIGGWLREVRYTGENVDNLTSDPANETFRDGFSWVSNDGTRRYVFGSNRSLKVLGPDGTVADITPAGLPVYPNAPTINVGYGKWLYGLGAYGAARPVDPDAAGRIFRWCFETWGEDLLSGSSDPSNKGPIYAYDVTDPLVPAAAIAGAPVDQNGFVVTDQRVVMAIGSQDEARLVRWSDTEDYSNWTPDATNWAGFQFLQGNGRLISIKKVLNQILIISESDAHIARFIGSPYIYGFDRVGDGCGPWNGQVTVATDRFVMWPGRRNFWMYDGALRQVPCDVQDYLSDNIDTAQLSKAYGFEVPQFNEIWWCYQSVDGDEVDSYVAYDYASGHWQIGFLDRTCGVNGEVYINPRMVSPEGSVYEHERSDVLVTDAFAVTGVLELGQGEDNLALRHVFPDTETFGDVTYQFMSRQMPTMTPNASPIYAYANPINTRVFGREIQMTVFGATRPDWKVGAKTRFDVAPGGTGKR